MVASNDIWQHRIDGVSLWAYVRSQILSAATPSAARLTPPLHIPTGRYLTSYRHLLGLSAAYDFLIVSSSLTHTAHHRDRIFAAHHAPPYRPLTVEVAQHHSTNYPPYPTIVENTLYPFYRAAKLLRPLSLSERTTIIDFVGALVEQFPIAPDSITRQLVQSVYRHRALGHVLDRFIVPQVRSRLAFVHAAAYMGHYASYVAHLHRHGFHVVEMQHGVPDHNYVYPFTYPHPAQNVLPDTLMTFGDFWHDHLTLPFPVVAVGYPHLEDVMQTTPEPNERDGILVISQPTHVQQLIQVAKHVTAAFPGCRVTFRPHPTETHPTDLAAHPNVRISSHHHETIHDLLPAHGVVVGAHSFALVEACIFPACDVYVLQNDVLPSGIGRAFTTADELVTMIRNAPPNRESSGQIFRPDARDNIAAFISRHI